MKIKVCGMRNVENLSSLLALKPDFVGFIFYNKSKRYVEEFPQTKFPKNVKKVGVFVNETVQEVLKKANEFELDCVQLHGNETPEYISQLRLSEVDPKPFSIDVIKAFSIDDNFDFRITNSYENVCDYFLFDTKGKDYGGNGIKFNWEILQNYKGRTPFLLSGGISKEDVEGIKKIHHKYFEGVDVNSGFEIEPGLKNIDDIEEFKNKL
jgi:phosphoribosylanthranilate isomerase